MKLFKTTLLAATATLAMASAANAADLAFNVGGATDYVFRGIDQTGAFSEGEVFGGVDATFAKSFYVGAWVSNTGPDADNGLEYDLYAGWKPSYMGASFDLGVIYYGYNNSNLGTVINDSDTFEFKAAGSYPIGPVTVGAAVYYSPDYASTDNDSFYSEVNASYTYKKATLSAAYGNFSVDAPGLSSYNTWNAGVTIPITDTFSFDARYIGSDSHASTLFGLNAFDGGVATIKATF